DRAARLDIIVTLLCDVIGKVFGFLVDVMTMLMDFVNGFVDLIVAAFGDNSGGSFNGLTAISLFVQYIAKELLTLLPFTQCFFDPDTSPVNPTPEDLLDILTDQLPKRLPTCVCPWVFEGPIDIPCLGCGANSGCRPVPNNLGTVFIQC